MSHRSFGVVLLAGLVFAVGARAANNDTADSAFTQQDGMREPVVAGHNPGQLRRADEQRSNAVLTATGAVVVSRLFGVRVYTASGIRLGSVRDVVLGPDGVREVVMRDHATGRIIALPWKDFRFGLQGNGLGERIVLPGMTENALSHLPVYRS